MSDMLEIFRLGHERHPSDDGKLFAFVREAVAFWLDPEKAVAERVISSKAPQTSEETAGEQPPPSPHSGPETAAALPSSSELTAKQHRCWRALCEMISETGVSPTTREIAERAGISAGSIHYVIHGVEAKQFARMVGRKWLPIIWPEGTEPRKAMSAEKATKRSYAPRQPGKPNRRFDHCDFDPTNVVKLPANHSALTDMRTLFRTTVTDPVTANRALISGANHSKIGDRVTKGPWQGMPIYVLTLEERATCPATCARLADCYGNNMPFAKRLKHGPELVERLARELAELEAQHPNGFVVRLHALGDFYSVAYVKQWGNWLARFGALHVFGYTAWPPHTEIGRAIQQIRDKRWNRFAIRFSSPDPKPGGATTIARRERGRIQEGMVCPAQTEPETCCGSCGLCWSPAMKDDCIVFMMHGRRAGPRSASADGPQPAAADLPKAAQPVAAKPSIPAPSPKPILSTKAEDERRKIDEALAAGKVTKISSSGMVEEQDDIDRLANWMRSAGYALGCKPHAPGGNVFIVNGNRCMTLDKLFLEAPFKVKTPPVTKQQIKSALMLRRMGVKAQPTVGGGARA